MKNWYVSLLILLPNAQSAFFDYEQCFSEQQATMPEYEHSLAATARKTYSFTQHGTKNEVFH